MSWARLDDQYPDHDKVEAAGPLGMALHVRLICHACKGKSGTGVIRASVVTRLAADLIPMAAALGQPHPLDALLETVPPYSNPLLRRLPSGDYELHDFGTYQPRIRRTAEDEAAIRKARSEAGRKGGRATQERRRAEANQANGEATFRGKPEANPSEKPSKSGSRNQAPFPSPDPVPVPDSLSVCAGSESPTLSRLPRVGAREEPSHSDADRPPPDSEDPRPPEERAKPKAPEPRPGSANDAAAEEMRELAVELDRRPRAFNAYKRAVRAAVGGGSTLADVLAGWPAFLAQPAEDSRWHNGWCPQTYARHVQKWATQAEADEKPLKNPNDWVPEGPTEEEIAAMLAKQVRG